MTYTKSLEWNWSVVTELLLCAVCVEHEHFGFIVVCLYFYCALLTVPCHLLRGSGSTVLTATGFVNGNHWFSTPPPTNSTPFNRSPKKFVTGDYVGNRYQCTKFGANPPTGGFWANAWNITESFISLFMYTLFFWELTYRSDRSADFRAWWLKRRGLAQRMWLWGLLILLPI